MATTLANAVEVPQISTTQTETTIAQPPDLAAKIDQIANQLQELDAVEVRVGTPIDPELDRLWRQYKQVPTQELRNRLVENYLQLVKYNGERIWARLPEGVELDDDVFCGPSCVFTNVMNPRSHISRKHEYRKTVVRRGTSIGANATIVCGTTLGAYSFIGAGAVVTSDVPDFALMVGVPARRIGWVCQCGVRLTVTAGTAVCAECGWKYVESEGAVRAVSP